MSHLRPSAVALAAAGLRVGIVAARFHPEIVDALLRGAMAALDRAGVAGGDRTVHRVAGAWEIPVGLERLARRGEVDALVALGAVVRGETAHFEFVSGECSRGCMEVALRHALPVGFGVLTCDDLDQARARAGGASGDKGAEAVDAALELALGIPNGVSNGAR